MHRKLGRHTIKRKLSKVRKENIYGVNLTRDGLTERQRNMCIFTDFNNSIFQFNGKFAKVIQKNYY